MNKGYKELTFLKLASARKTAEQMQKTYGYKPEIFKVTNPKTGNSKYVVIKPKRLKRIT